jgi:hypothetical protein
VVFASDFEDAAAKRPKDKSYLTDFSVLAAANW